MRANKGKDTKPELLLRKALWRMGFRYRLNSRLPGRPDMVFPSARVAVFVDGCFWHGCPEHFQQPANNAAFWKGKIANNVVRDSAVTNQLTEAGWLVLRFWEHEVNASVENCIQRVVNVLRARHAGIG